MEKNNDIRFIRIKGRIIPIKKKKVDEVKSAVGYTASGVAVSALAGRLYASTSKKAERMHQMSFNFGMDRPFSSLPKGITSAGEGMAKGWNLLKRSRKFLMAGQIAGGALLSHGIKKAIKSSGHENDYSANLGAEIGSQIASAIIVDQARRSFGYKTVFKMPSQATSLFKSIGLKLIKKKAGI